MKKHFFFMALLFLSCNMAFAQNSTSDDPQITDRNYKHPNKAAKANRLNTDQHPSTGLADVKDNTDYKHSFKSGKSTNRSSVSTGTTTRSYSGRTTTRNYKKQF